MCPSNLSGGPCGPPNPLGPGFELSRPPFAKRMPAAESWSVSGRFPIPDPRPGSSGAPLPFELDPVVVGERLAHDPLEVPDAPRGSRPLALRQVVLAAPHRLPPEQV